MFTNIISRIINKLTAEAAPPFKARYMVLSKDKLRSAEFHFNRGLEERGVSGAVYIVPMMTLSGQVLEKPVYINNDVSSFWDS
jgi:hypothetical protein